MNDRFLIATGLSKSYQLGRRKLQVLHDMNLIVPRGGFVAIQGASGAGKSTLLHLLVASTARIRETSRLTASI